jgi:hypothetical protein
MPRKRRLPSPFLDFFPFPDFYRFQDFSPTGSSRANFGPILRCPCAGRGSVASRTFLSWSCWAPPVIIRGRNPRSRQETSSLAHDNRPRPVRHE